MDIKVFQSSMKSTARKLFCERYSGIEDSRVKSKNAVQNLIKVWVFKFSKKVKIIAIENWFSEHSLFQYLMNKQLFYSIHMTYFKKILVKIKIVLYEDLGYKNVQI